MQIKDYAKVRTYHIWLIDHHLESHPVYFTLKLKKIKKYMLMNDCLKICSWTKIDMKE